MHEWDNFGLYLYYLGCLHRKAQGQIQYFPYHSTFPGKSSNFSVLFEGQKLTNKTGKKDIWKLFF